MITATDAGSGAGSGVLPVVAGWPSARGVLDATSRTVAWTVILFALAVASPARPAVGQTIPPRARAMAIALPDAPGVPAGGVADSAVFGVATTP